MRRKITVVGAGNVGALVAQRLAERDYADVVIFDPEEGAAAGRALDLAQAGAVLGYEPHLSGSDSPAAMTGSHLVVITSGETEAVATHIRDGSPNAIIVVATHTVDDVCRTVFDVTQFTRERLIGMAGVYHSARLRTFIARELGVSVRDVTGLVLTGPGDQLVPVASSITVAGVPVGELLTGERLDAVMAKVREPTAPAYTPAAGVSVMVDSIVLDQKRVLPCTIQAHGEYGIEEKFVGVPVKLGADGVEGVLEISLSDAELAALRGSS
jgi:malate dehydrogenase